MTESWIDAEQLAVDLAVDRDAADVRRYFLNAVVVDRAGPCRRSAVQTTHQMKPITIAAHRWLKNGDHPDDGGPGEGKVVRYFRDPDPRYAGELVHEECGRTWHDHGWLDVTEPNVVCPGDWVCLITSVDGVPGVVGEHWRCSESTFHDMYGPVASPVGVGD